MTHDLPSQRVPPQRDGEPGPDRMVPKPAHPKASGYAETVQRGMGAPNHPNPEAAGRQSAQSPGGLPGDEDNREPGETEETPPGENKREPIHDPDPADTKLHVQQSSR